MPSPFPGMNPYLEHPFNWRDFHNRFIVELAKTIGKLVRPRFFTRIDQTVYLQEKPASDRYPFPMKRPDVTVHESRRPPNIAPSGVTTLEAPAWVNVIEEFDEISVSSIDILDSESQLIVTSIEVLSPSNKNPGNDRESYRGKRARILMSTSNFIEIDLLRRGPRMSREIPACDYCILISRVQDRPQAGIWPLSLRNSLPPIPIPLKLNLPEPQLDLQAVFQRVFDDSDYEDQIYDRDPEPPLDPADAAWAEALLKTTTT